MGKKWRCINVLFQLSLSFTCVEGENARLLTVLQENAVLRSELEVMRLRCKNLTEDNRRLRQASVTIVSAGGRASVTIVSAGGRASVTCWG